MGGSREDRMYLHAEDSEVDMKTMYSIYPNVKCKKYVTFAKSKERQNSGRKKFPCYDCKKTFSDVCKLKRHVRNMHYFKRNNVSFDHCSNTFFDKSTLNKHRNVVYCNGRQKRKSGEMSCYYCNKRFVNKFTLKRHILTVIHDKKRRERKPSSYDCNKYTLKRPITNVHGNEAQFRGSSESNSTRIQGDSKSQKIAILDGQIDPITQNVGDKGKQNGRPTLDRPNMKSAGEKFKCNLCTAQLRNDSKLRNHMTLHLCTVQVERLKIYPQQGFVKVEAGKTENQKSIAAFVTGTEYRCNFCSAKLRNKSRLRLHKMIHTCTVPLERLEIGFVKSQADESKISFLSELDLCSHESPSTCSSSFIESQVTFQDKSFMELQDMEEKADAFLIESFLRIEITEGEEPGPNIEVNCKHEMSAVNDPNENWTMAYNETSRLLEDENEIIARSSSSYQDNFTKRHTERLHCLECDCRFSQYNHMVKHLKIHTATPLDVLLRRHDEIFQWKCEVCLERYEEKESLVEHLEQHIGQPGPMFEHPSEHLHVYNGGKQSHETEDLFINHLKDHDPSRSFVCHLCDYRSFDMRSLKSHVSDHDSSHRSRMCDFEMRIHCLQCGFIVPDYCRLASHLKSHRETPLEILVSLHSQVFRFQCEDCGSSYRQNSVLLQHEMRHNRDEHYGNGLQYTCNECDQMYSKESDLARHLLIHDSWRYICHLCNHRFLDATYLNFHLRKHEMSSQNPSKYKCNVCNQSYQQKASLIRHLTMHTTTGSRFLKGYGTQQYPTVQNPSTRQKKMKNRPRIFCCLECNLKFSCYKTLKGHLQKHTETPLNVLLDRHAEIYRYDCGTCGRIFREKEMLLNHFRKVHDQRLKCDKCHQEFLRKSRLLKHQKMHDQQILA